MLIVLYLPIVSATVGNYVLIFTTGIGYTGCAAATTISRAVILAMTIATVVKFYGTQRFVLFTFCDALCISHNCCRNILNKCALCNYYMLCFVWIGSSPK